MNPLRRLATYVLGALGLACAALPAQTAPSAPPSRELRFLAWEGAPGMLHLGSGPRAEPVALTSTRLSPPHAIKTGGDIPLIRRTTDAQGLVTETIYAVVEWPPGLERAIAIVAPAPSPAPGEPPGKVFLLPDDPARFAEHTMRFVNLTGTPIALRAGGAQATLQPRGETIAPYDPASGRLRVDFAALAEGEWRRLFGKNYPAPRDYRLLALIRPPTNLEPGVVVNRPAVTLILDRVTQAAGPQLPLPLHPETDEP